MASMRIIVTVVGTGLGRGVPDLPANLVVPLSKTATRLDDSFRPVHVGYTLHKIDAYEGKSLEYQSSRAVGVGTLKRYVLDVEYV